VNVPLPFRTLTAALLGGLLLAGCAGYRLGPTDGTVAGARSVEVRPLVNETFEPRLVEPLTQSLRKHLQQDGTLRLATRGDGDILLHTTLRQYARQPLTFQPGDVFSTRDYELRLTAHVRAVERGSGRVLLEREVLGRTTVRSAADLNSAERQAAPLVADDLARIITSLLVDGSW
jgi:hypothetical protein